MTGLVIGAKDKVSRSLMVGQIIGERANSLTKLIHFVSGYGPLYSVTLNIVEKAL